MLFHTEVTAAFCFGQGIQEGSVHPFGGEGREADAGCNFVRRLEADPRQLTELVGVLLDDGHGLLAVLFVELHRTVCRDAVRREKGDNIACRPVGEIRVTNLREPCLADAGDTEEFVRLLVQNLQGQIAVGVVDLLCDPRADTLELTGAEVPDNAVAAGDDDLVIAVHLKLGAVFGIAGPVALHVIAQVIGDRQKVPNGLELGEDAATAVADDLTGAVDRHHVAAGTGGVGILGIEELFKLTEHRCLLMRTERAPCASSAQSTLRFPPCRCGQAPEPPPPWRRRADPAPEPV